ncbi:ABC transporter family protein [Streptomyces puniciscabiei]|uniref:ABC transporter family protein n=1 Tax=Streptomyces puniciscabiei TaxID=164348 RepID=A0A542UKW0_9ACTN|nr:ATP-binding cassette domain-containing protein [Streptomyces puniciscabiei]TQK99704.1 ABC transporter family protein [Streptomyces puniciscabiei]
MDGVHVKAEGLGLKGPRGWAFRGVTLDAEPGSLIAIEGPSGSGRTCLLLALTGRMKPTEGVATVGGFKLPRQTAPLRRVSAVANVAGVTDLEPALTVGEHLRERALLQSRFGDSLRELLRPRTQRVHEARLRVDAALAAAGLDLETLPKGSRTAVRDLERPQELRLSIALALLGRPGLLGVDDLDTKLSDAERAELWELLRSLTRAGTTVAAVCRTAPGGCVVVPTGPRHTAAEAGTDDKETGSAAGTGDAKEAGSTAGTGDAKEAGAQAGKGDASEQGDPGEKSDPKEDIDALA